MIVCLCKGVSDQRILAAIRDGARTPAEVGRATGAGTDCGTCRETVADILRRALSPEGGPGDPGPHNVAAQP